VYTQRIIHFPALGRNAELRAAMEARTAAAVAAGSRHALATRIMSTEPAFIHSIQFENLAAIEAYQDRNAADPNFAAQTAKITQCLSQPQGTELFEILIPAQPTATPKFSLRVKRHPAPGKAPELRKLLEERVRSSVPGQVGRALFTQVASPEGAAFITMTLFAGLAGLDQFRAANAADPAFQKWSVQVSELTVGPTGQELLRILQPYPS